jgi:hypothetical protein
MSNTPHPSRRLAAHATAAGLAFAAFAAPTALGAEYEQIDRATGVTGASPLSPANVTASSTAITDDGRSAYFTFGVDQGPWAAAAGFYRREIDTNKTTLIAAGSNSRLVGLTNDGETVSFVTPARLSPADTNSLSDLYSYTAATGKIDLVSRADGVNGVALGLTSGGFIVRDGKTALFGTSLGIGKRTLATGSTVKVAGSSGTTPLGALHPGQRQDYGASADGSVFVSGTNLVSPGRVDLLPGYASDSYRPVLINDAGTSAVYHEDSGAHVSVYRTATRTKNTVDLRTAFGPDGANVLAIAADGTSLLAWTFAGTGVWALKRLDPATGTASPTGLETVLPDLADVPSRNLRFAITGRLFAVAATGSALPGGVDAPSPAVYATIMPACRAVYFPIQVAASNPLLRLEFAPPGRPPVESFTVTTYAANGQLSGRRTLTSEVPPMKLIVGTTPYRIVISATLVDGRTISESWNQPGAPATCPSWIYL